MKKLIISVIIAFCLVFAGMAYAADNKPAGTGNMPMTDCCSGNMSASGAAGNMSMGGCCGMHNDMIAIMASMIDVQKDIISTLKEGPKKQELQKKVSEMESLLKQVMREQNSQNCCGGNMQNMPGNMPMKNMPMQ